MSKKTFKFFKKPIRWAWAHSSNIVGWLGFVIACTSIYWQTLDKNHELNVVISSFDNRANWIVFGVLYSNPGDYVETVLDGSTILTWSESGISGWAHSLEECFSPVIIKPREAIHRYYSVHLPLQPGFDFENGLSNYPLSMGFRILMPNGAIKNEHVTLGQVEHRESDGDIESVSIEENVLSIRFTEEISPFLGSSYTPATHIPTDSGTCSNTLKPADVNVSNKKVKFTHP